MKILLNLFNISVVILITINCGGSETKQTVQDKDIGIEDDFFKNKAPENLKYKNIKSINLDLSKLYVATASKHRYIKISLDSKLQNTVYHGVLNTNTVRLSIPKMNSALFYEIYGDKEKTFFGEINIGELR
jgi:hypothetical protein